MPLWAMLLVGVMAACHSWMVIPGTIAGNDSTFRILMVTSSGKLTLNGLTITGGNTPGTGGGIFNLEGTLVLNHSGSPATLPRAG